MKIRVVGKVHRQGTSKKTGNDYNFIQVHYVAPARGVFGEAAQVLNLDPMQVKFDSILVPADYNVEFDQSGYPVTFTPCVK